MSQQQNPKKSASKPAEKNQFDNFESKLSSLTKYKWTVEKANLLLGSMIGLKPAGLHKHANMIFIQEKLYEKLDEYIPSPAIWEFLDLFWDMNAADKLEAKVLSPIINKDFNLPQTEEWSQLIDEEYNAILMKNNPQKDVNVGASTSKINSDEPSQPPVPNIPLNAYARSVITDEELIRMTSVKVMVERLNSTSSEDPESK